MNDMQFPHFLYLIASNLKANANHLSLYQHDSTEVLHEQILI